MVKFRKTNRKAISPIIATVLIIAVTLIAAVAIGGFVFGLFGVSSNTAQVQTINSSISHNLPSGTTLTVTCSPTPPTSPNGFIQLANTGSAATSVISFSITYAGQTYTSAPSGGTACSIAPGSTFYLTISAMPLPSGATINAGTQFSGFAVTQNGAQVVFSGAFS